MASTLPSHGPPPIPVVAIVVDSSITLAWEWHHILHVYLPHLLRRLTGMPASFAVTFPLFSALEHIVYTLPFHFLASPPRIRHVWTPRLRWLAIIR
jgi:hypothetical protein